MSLRIAALQPSVSVVLDRLGCLDRLVACTRYCVQAVPALAHMPVRVVQDSWSAKMEEVMATAPDLVVASVPYRIESLAAVLKAGVAVLALSPHSLADIYADIRLLGRVACAPETADGLVGSMQSELGQLHRRLTGEAERPLVYCEEWGKPLIHSQAWVDELIAIAGGRPFGKPGQTTDADAVRLADPDVLLFAWCGAGDRVPMEKIVARRGWTEMRAVRAGRVFCIPDEWLNTPAPCLLRGAQAIAAALHPRIFEEVQPPRPLRAPIAVPSI